MLTFSCSGKWILNTLKDFVERFYTFDFTGLLANINSDWESDFEIDLENRSTYRRVNNSVEVSDDHNSPSVSDETAG